MKNKLIIIYNWLYYKLAKISSYSLGIGARIENGKIISVMKENNIQKHSIILDVGCGYGRNLIFLKKHGYSPIGVDINENIVSENKKNGLSCLTVKEFSENDDLFDVIVISHVIEHMQPGDLLDFLNFYIGKLKRGGIAIILSPFPTKQFYYDFDHIKPYLPQSLMMIFQQNQQIQFYANHSLELIKTTIIRTPYTHRTFGYRFFFIKPVLKYLLDLFLLLSYYFSLKAFGVNSNWLSVFKKQLNEFEK